MGYKMIVVMDTANAYHLARLLMQVRLCYDEHHRRTLYRTTPL